MEHEKDGPAEKAMSVATWVVIIFAVLVVIGLVLFIIDLGLGEDEGALGLLGRL